MPVTEGSGSGQWPTTIQHVSNGEPASETVLRRPSIDLENRSLALRTFTEAQETLRDAQLGDADDAIGGVQGTFNTSHAHDGVDSAVIDLQKAYDNGSDDAVIKLAAAGSFEVTNSSDATLFKIDEATGKIIGTDIVGTAEIDWGTGADQVNADDIPSGTTNRIVSQAEYTTLNDHLTATDVHSVKYMGFALQKANVTVTGGSHIVTTQMAGETAGGGDGVEGIVTDSSHNNVIIKDASGDDILDATENKVYGRITESGGVWTLYFYSNVAGTENAYTGFSSTPIKWWVQKVYKPSTRPVYSPMFEVASDQVAAQVPWDKLQDSLIPASNGGINLGTDLKRFGSLYLSGDSIYVGDGQLKYDSGTSKLQFSHDGIDFADIGSGTGSGGAGTDLQSQLTAEELNQFYTLTPNTFVDDFQTNLYGTKEHCTAINNALRIDAGETDFYYEQSMEGSPASSAEGVIVTTLQALAPKNTVVSSNTFKFTGDVTEFFPDGKTVVIFKEYTPATVLRKQHVFLTDADGNVAKLVVNGAPTFSEVNNETSLVLTNTGALDLDLNVAEADYNEQLRIAPYDYDFEAKSKSSSDYESMDIDSASIYVPTTCRLTGENTFKQITGQTGTICDLTSAFSENGTYGIVCTYELTAGNGIFVWYGSTDRGVTWTKITTTKTSNTGAGEGLSVGSTTIPTRIFIANNGKWVCAYPYLSTSYQPRAVYGDLATAFQTINDTADTGSGGGSGFIEYNTAKGFGCIVTGDKEDLSHVAFVPINLSDNTLRVCWFTAGGATFDRYSSTTYSHNISVPTAVFVLGTGTSHKTVVYRQDNSSGNIYREYFSQGSGTTTATSLYSNIYAIRGVTCDYINNKVTIYFCVSSSNGRLGIDSSLLSSPSFTDIGKITTLSSDEYVGCSSGSSKNYYKIIYSNVIINKSNSNHVLAVADLNHPDGVVRSTLFEISDITNYKGIQISQYTSGILLSLRDSTSDTYVGQTFTSGTGTRIKTIAVRLYQNGTIPTGYTITTKIYNTSANLPTTPISGAVSTNTYDPSKITKSTSGQWCYFTFDSSQFSISDSTKYAIVLESDLPINASNHIKWMGASGNVYANGDSVYWTGSAWNIATGWDQIFEINGEWVTDIGQAGQGNTVFTGDYIHDQESQLKLIDNTNIQHTLRRIPNAIANVMQGHCFRRPITINQGGVKATIGDAKVAGYAETNYDPNLVFAVSYGNPVCDRTNVTTGGVADRYEEDRSGLDIVSTGYNLTVDDFVTDSDFESGKCVDLDGSSEYIAYTNVAPLQIGYAGEPFIVEAEIKVGAYTGANTAILSRHTSSSNAGIEFRVISDGSLQVGTRNADNSSNVSSASQIGLLVAGTYYKVKAVYDGTGYVHLYYKTKLGEWTEVTYTSNGTVTATSKNSSNMGIGGSPAGTGNFFNGKIGCVKIARRPYTLTANVPTFAYDGFKDQSPHTWLQNHGHKIIAFNKVGQNSTSATVMYNKFGTIDAIASELAVVDSYDQIFKVKKALDNETGNEMFFKASGGRGSERNQSSIQGLIVQFSK